jgi:hypothetical protein
MQLLNWNDHEEKTNKIIWLSVRILMGILLLALSVGPAVADDDEVEEPFGATSVIIETTDNDIELQVFVDGVLWNKLQIFTPTDRRIFKLRAQKNLRRQGGLSELFFASEPTHYLEDEPEYDGTVEAVLSRFPEGKYEFEGRTVDGRYLEGKATLTHVLPELPEIMAPISDGDDPPVVDPANLVIEWEPVTTRFIGDGPVEIIEYQVILDPVDEREQPWIDGKTRRALINLPGSATSCTVPPEFLLPNALYDFEVMAIEASGNATISTGEFMTSE